MEMPAAAQDLASQRGSHYSLEEQLIRDLQSRLQVSERERARLQKARDELAAALLAAEERAAEADERADAAAASAARYTQRLASAAGLQPDEAQVLLDELDKERDANTELTRQLEAAQAEGRDAAHHLQAVQKRLQQLEQWKQEQQQLQQRGVGSSGGGGVGGNLRASASMASLTSEQLGEVDETEQRRVAALKSARDKLIAALDTQSAEVERLAGENSALAQAVNELRDVAAKWEVQAQGALGQTEQLKDLLEESATWTTPALGTAARPPHDTAVPAGTATCSQEQQEEQQQDPSKQQQQQLPGAEQAHAAAALVARCEELEGALLLEKARSNQLDLQVRALCMELTRAAQASGQMQAALLPLLGGVEARLVEVLGLRAPAAVTALPGQAA